MSDFIEEFYYGNIKPQECATELKPKIMKCLNELASKEKYLTDTLTNEDKKLFTDMERGKRMNNIVNAIEEIILNEIAYR